MDRRQVYGGMAGVAALLLSVVGGIRKRVPLSLIAAGVGGLELGSADDTDPGRVVASTSTTPPQQTPPGESRAGESSAAGVTITGVKSNSVEFDLVVREKQQS